MYETTSEEEDDEMLVEGGDDTLQRSIGVVDVEDLGKVMKNMKKAKVCLLLMMPKVWLWWGKNGKICCSQKCQSVFCSIQ